jgi:hypothetical protein
MQWFLGLFNQKKSFSKYNLGAVVIAGERTTFKTIQARTTRAHFISEDLHRLERPHKICSKVS